MRYFDYEKAAKEAQLSSEQLALLSVVARKDYPRDDMLYELYLMRMCKSIRDGRLTMEAAIEPDPEPMTYAEIVAGREG